MIDAGNEKAIPVSFEARGQRFWVGFLLFIFLFTTLQTSMMSMAWSKRPILVSHKGAGKDSPENTLLGFVTSIKDGAEMLEMDVQITKDMIPVLYHPTDLATLTDCNGRIDERTHEEIKKCNINGTKSLAKIPSLEAVLRKTKVSVILDLKSNNVKELIDAIASVLDKTHGWKRAIFYSTKKEHLLYLQENYPFAKTFQDRDSTRKILLNMKINGTCYGEIQQDYFAFELKKDSLFITEKLTLGTYETELRDVVLFNKETIHCLRKLNDNVKIFLFGITSQEYYNYAKEIGVDGVFLDSMKQINAQE